MLSELPQWRLVEIFLFFLPSNSPSYSRTWHPHNWLDWAMELTGRQVTVNQQKQRHFPSLAFGEDAYNRCFIIFKCQLHTSTMVTICIHYCCQLWRNPSKWLCESFLRCTVERNEPVLVCRRASITYESTFNSICTAAKASPDGWFSRCTLRSKWGAFLSSPSSVLLWPEPPDWSLVARLYNAGEKPTEWKLDVSWYACTGLNTSENGDISWNSGDRSLVWDMAISTMHMKVVVVKQRLWLWLCQNFVT